MREPKQRDNHRGRVVPKVARRTTRSLKSTPHGSPCVRMRRMRRFAVVCDGHHRGRSHCALCVGLGRCPCRLPHPRCRASGLPAMGGATTATDPRAAPSSCRARDNLRRRRHRRPPALNTSPVRLPSSSDSLDPTHRLQLSGRPSHTGSDRDRHIGTRHRSGPGCAC